MHINQRKDYYAGALVALIGAAAVYEGLQYDIGTLTQMGSGFFPAALGILLMLVGVLIAGTASQAVPPPAGAAARRGIDLRGWVCIIGGGALFIVLAQYAGMLAATFACVFVAAMGDRQSSWKQAALLATGITIFGILLFAFGLKVQIPILHGM